MLMNGFSSFANFGDAEWAGKAVAGDWESWCDKEFPNDPENAKCRGTSNNCLPWGDKTGPCNWGAVQEPWSVLGRTVRGLPAMEAAGRAAKAIISPVANKAPVGQSNVVAPTGNIPRNASSGAVRSDLVFSRMPPVQAGMGVGMIAAVGVGAILLMKILK